METKVSHARFYGLLSQMPRADKEDLVWQYSHTVTNSLSEFYAKLPNDYKRMLNDMQAIVNEISAKPKPVKEDKAELKRYRSAILHRLQKHGIDTTNWNVVNAFMSQPKIAGKTLGKMTIDELKAFIPKMESILSKDKVKQAELKRISQLN